MKRELKTGDLQPSMRHGNVDGRKPGELGYRLWFNVPACDVQFQRGVFYRGRKQEGGDFPFFAGHQRNVVVIPYHCRRFGIRALAAECEPHLKCKSITRIAEAYVSDLGGQGPSSD